MSFTYKVFNVIKTIPKGQVMTFKQVAKLAGNENAYRSIGNIIKKNPDLKNIPCHRVVKSNYTLSKNSIINPKEQKKILIKEGVKFNKNKIIID